MQCVEGEAVGGGVAESGSAMVASGQWFAGAQYIIDELGVLLGELPVGLDERRDDVGGWRAVGCRGGVVVAVDSHTVCPCGDGHAGVVARG